MVYYTPTNTHNKRVLEVGHTHTQQKARVWEIEIRLGGQEIPVNLTARVICSTIIGYSNL